MLTVHDTPGPSRCFPFWQEVLGCYVVNSGEGEAGKKKCLPALEDYHECLHHRKEVRFAVVPGWDAVAFMDTVSKGKDV